MPNKIRSKMLKDSTAFVRVWDEITGLRDSLGVSIQGGQDQMKGKLVRIGHMGPTARPMYSLIAVSALGGAIRALGRPVDVAAGVAAALEVIDRGVDASQR